MTRQQHVFEVTAERSSNGKWWVLECAEVGAVSQVRRLDDVDEEMREAIAYQTGLPVDEILIVTAPILPARYYELSAQAEELRRESNEAKRAAAEASSKSARTLADIGLTVREIGTLMGVSFQRAQQLVKG